MTIPSKNPRSARWLAGAVLLLAMAVFVPTTADAKRKKDYSDKLYDGVSIEEYCSELLSVEAFDLTDEDLETCDERYMDELGSLDDVDLGGIQLGDSSASSSEFDEEQERADPSEPKLSKKELEEQRLAAEAAEKKRLGDLGIVDFGESNDEEAAGDDEDEEDDDLGDGDFGDEDLEEDVDVFDGGEDTLVEDFDTGSGGGSGLDDLDDEFGEDEDRGDKKKDKKKKKKKKKGSSGSGGGFDDAMEIPDGLE